MNRVVEDVNAIYVGKPDLPPNSEQGRKWLFGECSVITSKDDGRWHLSIAHPTRYPTWDEIRDARYEFLPTVPAMAMVLPPKSLYVNAHPNAFHLWELRDDFSEWTP